MKKLSIIITLIVLLSGITHASSLTEPDEYVSSVVVSRGRAVYAMLTYEKENDSFTIIKAGLEQDIHALENAFKDLVVPHSENKSTVLLLRAVEGSRLDSGTDGKENKPIAIVSSTPAAALTRSIPGYTGRNGILFGGQIMDVSNLGRAYIVDTTIDRMNFSDLLSFVLMLPQLRGQTRTFNVYENALLQIKDTAEYKKYSSIELDLGQQGMWSTEGKSFVPVWKAGVLTYYLADVDGSKLLKLDPLDHYLARPSWSPPVPRLIAGATERELIIVDTFSGETHRIDLTELFSAEYLMMSESIELVSSPDAETVYFTLSFNLPKVFWDAQKHTYSYNLTTRRLNVETSEMLPEAQIDEPSEEAELDSGVITEPFVDTLYGHISPVWILMGQGWHAGQLSRYQSFLSPQWYEKLPEDESFVFQPTQMMIQHRFIAYGSQEEVLLFDLIAQKHHRLSLEELKPIDLSSVSKLRFAQNPINPEDKIYIFLEDRNQSIAAYIWDLSESAVEPLEATLEELQRDGQDGWWEFTAGTVSFLLPAGTSLLSGSAARDAITYEALLRIADEFVSFLIWLSATFFVFLLPYVLARAGIVYVFLNRKNLHPHFGLAPLFTALCFVGLSIIANMLIAPFNSRIDARVYPLLWYPESSSTGMIIMLGFMIIVTVLLTILAYYSSRKQFRQMFQNKEYAESDKKSVAFTDTTVYGLCGAVLLLLFFLYMAVTLPYRLSPDMEPFVVVGIFYAVCLAVTFFLLKAPLSFVGYFTSAALFLGVGVFFYYAVLFIRSVSGHPVIEAARQLINDGWLSNLALIFPQALVCIIYLLRVWMEFRKAVFKTSTTFLTALLVSVPATAVIIYAEQIHLFLPRLGFFALPFAFVLIASVIGAFVLALVYLIKISIRRSKKSTSSHVTVSPTVAKFKITAGLVVTVIAIILMFVYLVLYAATGALWIPGDNVGLLLLQLFVSIASVYYLGNFLSNTWGRFLCVH